MQEIQSKVNFKKLVHDLADMYQDDTFDVVLTELVANALDAKASEISISWDDRNRTLVVMDDGNGMDSEAFAQYHDFAAELKTRGDGIGFAGVGAKISFNIAHRVVTETRCDGLTSASDWRWHDDGTLRWNRIQANRLKSSGTRVEVHFDPGDIPTDVDSEYLIAVLKRHYLPLFISEFVDAYAAGNLYLTRPRFVVNGALVQQVNLDTIASLIQRVNLKLGSAGWGAIGVSERDCPVGDGAYGVLLCTHGKVIKHELFGLSTGVLGTKLFGIVEIPGLIDYLTTNKSDLKGGPGRSKGLRQLLDLVSEELKKFLAKHGVAAAKPQRNRLSEKLERELTKMIKQLPELQDFDGLLRKSRVLRKNMDGNTLTTEVTSQNTRETTHSDNRGHTNGSNGGSSRAEDKTGKTQANQQRSRRNQGPRVAFEEHPDRGETAWLNSDVIVINSGHGAYRRQATQEQASLTYCMFAIGIALDKAELVPPPDGISYVDRFITIWGQS